MARPSSVTTSPAAAGNGASSATLTIGDETWEFDSVEFCGVPASPDTSSFVLIAKVGDWQLIAEVVDDQVEGRLVPQRDEEAMAAAIVDVLGHGVEAHALAVEISAYLRDSAQPDVEALLLPRLLERTP